MEDPLTALAEPNRRRILHLLGQGEMTVTELSSQFGVTRSAISQHLGVLTRSGLVTARREGRFQYYRVDPTGMQRLHDTIDAFWTTELEELATSTPKPSKETLMSCEKSVIVPLNAEQTFAMLTEPERLRRWSAVCSRMDVRVGGDYRWTVNPGHTALGSFTEVEPGKRLVYTWGWEDSAELPPGASTVTVTLEPADGGTLVRLVHEGLDADQAEGHVTGWTHFLDRLVIAGETGDAGFDDWGGGIPTDQLTSAEACLAACERALMGITPETRSAATPCSEYTVDQLADHLIDSLVHLGAMAGAKVDDGGREISPEIRIANAGQQAIEAWRLRGTEGTVDMGGMELPAEIASGILSVELLVHGWDFAQASGVEFAATPEMAEYVFAQFDNMPVDQMREVGRFGPEIKVGPDDAAINRLMAFTGRSVG
jgi:uncharacterized protein (TIGR03086 family)